jgi:hypothetical protein
MSRIHSCSTALGRRSAVISGSASSSTNMSNVIINVARDRAARPAHSRRPAMGGASSTVTLESSGFGV